jgi:hypothetical protein
MISLAVIAIGTATFLGAFLVHAAVWRRGRPPREMTRLFAIFLALPFSLYLAAALAVYVGDLTGASLYPFLFAFLWHLALSSAYIMTYPPIQAGCPSLKIVLLVKNAGPAGLSADEIRSLFSRDALFEERFYDLVKDGLVAFKYDAWGITLGGRVLSRLFIAYRCLLKLPLGEG